MYFLLYGWSRSLLHYILKLVIDLRVTSALCSVVSYALNPLEFNDNSATSNNMKLAHWPLMAGLLH